MFIESKNMKIVNIWFNYTIVCVSKSFFFLSTEQRYVPGEDLARISLYEKKRPPDIFRNNSTQLYSNLPMCRTLTKDFDLQMFWFSGKIFYILFLYYINLSNLHEINLLNCCINYYVRMERTLQFIFKSLFFAALLLYEHSLYARTHIFMMWWLFANVYEQSCIIIGISNINIYRNNVQ